MKLQPAATPSTRGGLFTLHLRHLRPRPPPSELLGIQPKLSGVGPNSDCSPKKHLLTLHKNRHKYLSICLEKAKLSQRQETRRLERWLHAEGGILRTDVLLWTAKKCKATGITEKQIKELNTSSIWPAEKNIISKQLLGVFLISAGQSANMKQHES